MHNVNVRIYIYIWKCQVVRQKTHTDMLYIQLLLCIVFDAADIDLHKRPDELKQLILLFFPSGPGGGGHRSLTRTLSLSLFPSPSPTSALRPFAASPRRTDLIKNFNIQNRRRPRASKIRQKYERVTIIIIIIIIDQSPFVRASYLVQKEKETQEQEQQQDLPLLPTPSPPNIGSPVRDSGRSRDVYRSFLRGPRLAQHYF